MRNAGDTSTARHEVAGTAIDPVCGMTVATVDATPHADVDGTRYWFCAVGCRDTFTASHSAPATA
jgi:xanthine dehydrogenase accessory factor